MSGDARTRKQLLAEVEALRRRVAELEASRVKPAGPAGPLEWAGVSAPELLAALRESEERFRTIFEAARNVAFVTTDLNGPEARILDFSPGAEEIFGYSREEAVGQPLAILHPSHQVKHFGLVTERMRRSRASVTAELELVRKSGERFPAILTTFPILDDAGNMEKILGVSIDITDRKRVEEALRESEERYRSLVENMDLGITLIDRDYRVVMTNVAHGRLFDKRPEEFVGKHCYEEFEKRGDVCPHCPGARAMASGEPHEVETEGVRDDGTRFPVRVQAFPTFGADGEAIGFIEVAEDIAGRKRAEDELRAHQRRLRSLASQLSLAEEQERRRIASDLHDSVGQLLAIAGMRLGVLQQKPYSADFGRRLQDINKLIEQASRTMQSLIFELSPPALYELGLAAAVELLAEQMREQHGLEVAVRADGGKAPMTNDVRSLLFKAVRELLMNVVKHAKATRAEVRISKGRDGVLIEVADNGVGFDVEQLDARRDRVGGFGLFSIRERLEHLGGSVNIESALGKGTVVTAALPLDDTTDERGGTEHEHADPSG